MGPAGLGKPVCRRPAAKKSFVFGHFTVFKPQKKRWTSSRVVLTPRRWRQVLEAS
jgi:hypothetical protein